jgi:hypothetical protein
MGGFFERDKHDDKKKPVKGWFEGVWWGKLLIFKDKIF